mgnify:CR=1 FL=1
MHHSLRLLIGLFGLLALLACDDDTTGQAADDTPADSLSVALPDSSAATPHGTAPAAEVPELIGQWQLQEMWVGNSLMSVGDVGETYLHFKANGTVVSYAPNLSPDSSRYLYRPAAKEISADALQGTQAIKTLDESELVLTYKVDGEEVRSVYTRRAD